MKHSKEKNIDSMSEKKSGSIALDEESPTLKAATDEMDLKRVKARR